MANRDQIEVVQARVNHLQADVEDAIQAHQIALTAYQGRYTDAIAELTRLKAEFGVLNTQLSFLRVTADVPEADASVEGRLTSIERILNITAQIAVRSITLEQLAHEPFDELDRFIKENRLDG